MKRYNPKEIEPKWQKVWQDTGLYKTDQDPAKDPYYCLVMFPYPSGNLHVGHWYNFGPADTVARFHRMLGKRVLHPIGFDAFGLPAENAAIKHDIPPAEWTWKNIETMTKQLKTIGTMYDWDKQVITAKPDYYKWTQWLFLKLYKNGLAYRKEATVNWCPKDQTVLANEQVVGDANECERCGTQVEQKELEQWYFKITDYAERLLDDLEDLDWPERVKTMQQNWIGRSTGAEIDFKLAGAEETIRVFTTRPDTIYGATFMVLAPEHPLVDKITTDEQKSDVEAYLKQVAGKTELERKQDEKKKTGVFSGAYAINPATEEKIPIWIGDFVLMSYGQGAIMAVPGHDERDYDFAKTFGLAVTQVIENDQNIETGAIVTEGTMVNSDKYDGIPSQEAREKMVADFTQAGWATEQTNYKLRDWLISRQRYWGAPIPVVYCQKCGEVPVPEDQLPVELPEDVAFEPTGKSPLLSIDEFVNTKCPECGGNARRETDTMDTFVDSSWYYLRYPNTAYEQGAFDPKAVKDWMPVDHYIGGIEHAILHLLYSRFITKTLHDHHDLPYQEPFKKLSNQGMILGPDGQKMSKSKGNVVDPDEQVGSYGADSLRLYLMFMGPYDQGGPYDFGGIAGTRRFIERLWQLVMEVAEAPAVDKPDPIDETVALSVVHKTVKKVTQDLEKMSFNTAIAALMELVNTLNKEKANLPIAENSGDWREMAGILVRLAAPFMPHVAEELWQELGHDTSVHLQHWPAWNEKLLVEEFTTIVVQVNGKVRANIDVQAGSDEAAVKELALQDQNVQTHLDDTPPKKIIYVADKLINFVV